MQQTCTISTSTISDLVFGQQVLSKYQNTTSVIQVRHLSLF